MVDAGMSLPVALPPVHPVDTKETDPREPAPVEAMEDDTREPADGVSKKSWTDAEDRILSDIVTREGAQKWQKVAESLPGRAGKQCRERWFNHICPEVRKGSWTTEEDRIIMESVREHGTKWSFIVKALPGRTDNAIKNRYNSAMRREQRLRKIEEAAAKGETLPTRPRGRPEGSGNKAKRKREEEEEQARAAAADAEMAARASAHAAAFAAVAAAAAAASSSGPGASSDAPPMPSEALPPLAPQPPPPPEPPVAQKPGKAAKVPRPKAEREPKVAKEAKAGKEPKASREPKAATQAGRELTADGEVHEGKEAKATRGPRAARARQPSLPQFLPPDGFNALLLSAGVSPMDMTPTMEARRMSQLSAMLSTGDDRAREEMIEILMSSSPAAALSPSLNLSLQTGKLSPPIADMLDMAAAARKSGSPFDFNAAILNIDTCYPSGAPLVDVLDDSPPRVPVAAHSTPQDGRDAMPAPTAEGFVTHSAMRVLCQSAWLASPLKSAAGALTPAGGARTSPVHIEARHATASASIPMSYFKESEDDRRSSSASSLLALVSPSLLDATPDAAAATAAIRFKSGRDSCEGDDRRSSVGSLLALVSPSLFDATPDGAAATAAMRFGSGRDSFGGDDRRSSMESLSALVSPSLLDATPNAATAALTSAACMSSGRDSCGDDDRRSSGSSLDTLVGSAKFDSSPDMDDTTAATEGRASLYLDDFASPAGTVGTQATLSTEVSPLATVAISDLLSEL